ncbi:hypothetical protein [Embleya sp. AB8]|uniref:hypothetical protein n=1 Tax=Embleya sp. AB8 TaxID=3156304 RepID=UPI003C792AE6
MDIWTQATIVAKVCALLPTRWWGRREPARGRYVPSAVHTVGSGGLLHVEEHFPDGHRIRLHVEIPARGR